MSSLKAFKPTGLNEAKPSMSSTVTKQVDDEGNPIKFTISGDVLSTEDALKDNSP